MRLKLSSSERRGLTTKESLACPDGELARQLWVRPGIANISLTSPRARVCVVLPEEDGATSRAGLAPESLRARTTALPLTDTRPAGQSDGLLASSRAFISFHSHALTALVSSGGAGNQWEGKPDDASTLSTLDEQDQSVRDSYEAKHAHDLKSTGKVR